mmetsp:Transcript_9947/g.14873  ORF Transcript_9947/g.14873 Transcript_9947/m.14873 type:complete len:201 (-) Transcript_9947:126-728(-)
MCNRLQTPLRAASSCLQQGERHLHVPGSRLAVSLHPAPLQRSHCTRQLSFQMLWRSSPSEARFRCQGCRHFPAAASRDLLEQVSSDLVQGMWWTWLLAVGRARVRLQELPQQPCLHPPPLPCHPLAPPLRFPRRVRMQLRALSGTQQTSSRTRHNLRLGNLVLLHWSNHTTCCYHPNTAFHSRRRLPTWAFRQCAQTHGL